MKGRRARFVGYLLVDKIDALVLLVGKNDGKENGGKGECDPS